MSAVKKTETSKAVSKAKTTAKKSKIPVRKVSVSHVSQKPIKLEEEQKAARVQPDKLEELWLENEDEQQETVQDEPVSYSQSKIKSGVKDRSINLYRKISISFIFLTAILLAVIFYFSFVKVDIKVTLKKQTVNSNLVADIYNQGGQARDGAIEGLIKEVAVEQTKQYEATGKDVTGSEAVGKIKITNNYDKNQPLVASTRFLSADGKLFRLKNTVNVPANGSIDAEIYADQPSPESAIGPTKFTIPGLWAGLQDKIYGETTEPIQYQEKVQKSIQQTDIDNGLADIKQVLIEQAKGQLAESITNYNQVLYQVDENTMQTAVDSKVGEQKDSFSIKVKANVVIVAFDDSEIKKLAEQKLRASLDDNKELVKFNQGQVACTLNTFDATQGTASVNVSFDGEAITKGDSVINKDNLLGLTDEQLRNYLKGIPEIENFEIRFSPAFIKKVPNLVDRINIEVQQ